MIGRLTQLEQYWIWSRRGDSLYEPFLRYLQGVHLEAPHETSTAAWPVAGGWISRAYLKSNPEFVHKTLFKRCWSQIRKQPDPIIETFVRDGLEYTVDLRQRISFQLYSMGRFERHIIETMRAHLRPDDIVFDIGANTGSTTLPLAQMLMGGGQIYSFEPNPDTFKLLAANVAANKFNDRVSLNNFALGNSEETLILRVPEFNDGGASFLESWKSKQHRTSVQVSMKSFSAFWESAGFPRPRLVKIDVEGYEPVLLKGMTEFLRDVNPILVVEVSPEVPGCWEMLATLEALDYQVMEIRPDGHLEVVRYRKTRQFDVLCIPKQRTGES